MCSFLFYFRSSIFIIDPLIWFRSEWKCNLATLKALVEVLAPQFLFSLGSHASESINSFCKWKINSEATRDVWNHVKTPRHFTIPLQASFYFMNTGVKSFTNFSVTWQEWKNKWLSWRLSNLMKMSQTYLICDKKYTIVALWRQFR